MAVVGYTLLGILILLLVLILVVLFFPISYRVDGKKNADGLFVNAKVKWLFGLLRILYDYPKPAEVKIKIAWITLGERKARKKPKKSKKKKKEDAQSTDAPNSTNETQAVEGASQPAETMENAEAPNDTPASDEASLEASAPDTEVTDQAETGQASEAEPEEREGAFEPNPASDQKPSKKKKKGFQTGGIKKKIAFYKELWEEPDTQPFVKEALRRILRVLKNLLPRKITGFIRFGAETPDVTGYIYGSYCTLRALYPKRILIDLVPDFENKILQAEFQVKGHFNVFMILVDALCLLFDKRLKKIKKALDDHKE